MWVSVPLNTKKDTARTVSFFVGVFDLEVVYRTTKEGQCTTEANI